MQNMKMNLFSGAMSCGFRSFVARASIPNKRITSSASTAHTVGSTLNIVPLFSATLSTIHSNTKQKKRAEKENPEKKNEKENKATDADDVISFLPSSSTEFK